MLGECLEFIRKEVRDYLGVADDEVVLDAARTLIQDNTKRGCYISLVNLEEEAALKNLPTSERRLGQLKRVEPPVFLNLYLLFAFEFQTYPTSITHLGKLIEMFQAQRFFDAGTQSGPGAVVFPAGLERIVLEMVNMNFEALHNLWGILGGSHFPSVIYRVRLVKVAADTATDAPEITTIRLDVGR